MPKEQTYWCVYNRGGQPLISTMEYFRKDCVGRFIRGSFKPWSYWRSEYGYTVKKVTINIVTK